ncbi:unnamed protein product [Soboliphyme baturini]|uniref:Mediator of RNA polymerase II transcription subunit 10 n=1 Tax=Soboliphyme baturini TaxID=241478 RepID=A0A183J612_9BILA|nr:unnamed protein product [Soboliphyme baturini]
MLLSMDLAVPDVEYMSEKFLKTVGFSFDLSLNSQVRNGEKVTSSQEIIPQPLKDLEALLRNMGFNYENETEGHNLDIKCDKTFIRGILKDVEMAARNPGFPFSKVVPMISLLENKRNAMLEAGSRRACDNKNALFKISLIKEICTVLKRVLELKSRFAA